MSNPAIYGSAIDAAHFFTRVLQIGLDVDIAQCSAALLDVHGQSVSRVRSTYVERRGKFREESLQAVDFEGARQAKPQLEEVARLLLDVGSDLPLLRLAGLMMVATNRRRQADPWFIQRDLYDGSRLSYVRRLYDDGSSQGHVDILARTFRIDPTMVAARVQEMISPLTSAATNDWAHIEGTFGGAAQVEVELYWDGFVSIELRATDAASFDRITTQLLGAVASFVPVAIPNLGVALMDAVSREGLRSIQ